MGGEDLLVAAEVHWRATGSGGLRLQGGDMARLTAFLRCSSEDPIVQKGCSPGRQMPKALKLEGEAGDGDRGVQSQRPH